MHEIIDTLGVFGDGIEHYKEEAYELLRMAHPELKLTPKSIDKRVKKYVEYGLMTRVKDLVIRGYYKWKITEKGIEALDYYRAARGYKDLAEGALF